MANATSPSLGDREQSGGNPHALCFRIEVLLRVSVDLDLGLTDRAEGISGNSWPLECHNRRVSFEL